MCGNKISIHRNGVKDNFFLNYLNQTEKYIVGNICLKKKNDGNKHATRYIFPKIEEKSLNRGVTVNRPPGFIND